MQIKNRAKTLGLLLVVLASLLSTQARAIPDIQHWQTANGAKVMFVPVDNLPMVDIRIVFDAGSARDDGKGGVGTLTNGLLAEGAGGLSSQQIAENFESVGAEFDNAALRDMGYVGLRSQRWMRLLVLAGRRPEPERASNDAARTRSITSPITSASPPSA